MNALTNQSSVNSISAELDSVWMRIFYHVWWPSPGNDPMYALNANMNRSRSDYYQGNYTPHMFTNGFDSGSSVSAWVEDSKKYLKEVSVYDISFQGTRSTDSYNFEIIASALKNTDDISDIRLFVATVMGKVVYPGSYNGMYEHHNVIIEQLAGNTGKSIKFIANVDYVESFSWSIPSGWINSSELRWNENNLKVIAWVQNYSTKEILQAAEFNFK